MPVSSTRSELLKRARPVHARAERRGAGDVAALHRARVASRRLRELLPMLQLDHDKSRKLRPTLRKVTRRLGAVRELDVLLLLDRRTARRPPRPHRRARARRHQRRQGPRRRAQAPVRRGCRSTGMRRLGAEARPDGRASCGSTEATPAQAPPRAAGALAVDAQVARRASRARRGDDRRRRGVSARTAARRAHRAEEAALRARTRRTSSPATKRDAELRR